MKVILITLFASMASVKAQNDVSKKFLLVLDDNFIHQLPIDSSKNYKTILRFLYQERVEFLNANRFRNIVSLLYGGRNSSSVGYFFQVDNAVAAAGDLKVPPALKVCYAAPGVDGATFFALSSSGWIFLFNFFDFTVTTILHSTGNSCPSPPRNFQIDYNNRILYYLKCSQEQTLQRLNLAYGALTEIQLKKTVQKFEIDFSSEEIFAISSKILLKGKLKNQEIHFEECLHASDTILDFSLSPEYIYIIILGKNNITKVDRSDCKLFYLEATFSNPKALAYLELEESAQGISRAESTSSMRPSDLTTPSNSAGRFTILFKTLSLFVIFLLLDIV